MNRMNIAIAGGSVAGCAAAAALLADGHHVAVFERSPRALTGRGAGIGTQASVLRSMVERGLVDRDMPTFHAEGFPHVGRTIDQEPLGRTAWVAPVTIEVLNWGDLYGNLRRREIGRAHV